MVIVATIYLRFYSEVEVGVGTFLPIPTPPKIPSDSDFTALVSIKLNFHGNIHTRKDLIARFWGMRWGSWLRHCATSLKVAGSSPMELSGRTMTLGLT
jgi:hypothetical protein